MYQDEDLRVGTEELEAGRPAVALERFALAADGAAEPHERLAAVAFAADVNLTLGRPYEAIAWAERLRAESATSDEADLLEGAAWVALGDGDQAVRRLAAVRRPDTRHKTYPQAVIHQLRCEAYGLVGDVDRASVEAITALSDDWRLPEVWRALVNLASEHEVDLAAPVAAIPDDELLQVLAWLVDAPALGVDRLAEALWQRTPDDRRLLALMTSVGNRLPLERAVEWSARLRTAGLARECSVLGRAAREDLAAGERIRAAAVAASAFGDERSVPLLEAATALLPDDQVRVVLSELLEIGTDDLVDAFVVTAASSAGRSLALATELVGRGAEAPARALARHGVELTTGQPDALRAAVADALTGAERDQLAAALRGAGATDVATALQAV